MENPEGRKVGGSDGSGTFGSGSENKSAYATARGWRLSRRIAFTFGKGMRMNILLGIMICYTATLAFWFVRLQINGEFGRISILPTCVRLIVPVGLFAVPGIFLGGEVLGIILTYFVLVLILSGFPIHLFPPLVKWATVWKEEPNKPQHSTARG